MAIWRRDPRDGEILRLALPAFGALAAEPLYVLADTAIVGHLGTRPLAGLAVAGTLLTVAVGIFNFLAYATTAAVARRIGAGDRTRAAEQGVDSLWLALGLGLALTVVGLVVAEPVVRAMGASARIRPDALTYLRISLLGAPAVLIALAAPSWAITVPQAEPAIPRPNPNTSTTSSTRLPTLAASWMTSGVRVSWQPRR